MLALLQRVNYAKVHVNDECVASIKKGILMFAGFQPHDNITSTTALLERTLNYRLFSDEQGKMNLSLTSLSLELLIVPQFTLAADTRSGLRPSFSKAAPPLLSKNLFEHLYRTAKQQHPHIQFGQFGADMKISLCNDGPVTFMLDN